MQFYTVKEFAEMVKISEKTVTRYIKTGDLEAVKFGGQWRITESAVQNYIKNNSNIGGREND
ncbi:DNA binding domain%2C excisionase family [Streptococcus pneumoniae]|uniref:helix-turn-helix domain-containing protein n=1 Tax=Bacilli TaxID=91061 RepID=UPI0005DD0332|nr:MULTISPECIES: helix-turn-helix domain-containing protein [Bacilli]CKE76410.1 DNA binding domain%2C excisionase family [Streptococcus pneumoniae]CKE78915.1 DNA binding domain%2C excisionase family [Streptococcus pneumoniae]CKE88502.1 DNA binding domain%2C excisionase family [Streptococcus pneumoniae]CKF07907.1 DNA binding domain%2C excisionase family [Streptococcus pneumoniae]CKF16841.1 DNA binding domain%2C excisionase family [Streptococcus pneumoniae]